MILIPLIIAISFAYFYVALAVSRSFSKFFAKADYMDAIVSAKKVMISTTLKLAIIPTLLAALALPATMQGQEFAKHNESKIITFDVPNAGKTAGKLNCGANLLTGCYGTTPMANNNAGEIVGMYITDDGVYYGFLRSPEGRVTEFSEPNADTTPGDFNGTYPMSLNSWGAVTGLYQKVDEVLHGFIREPDGGYVEVDDPSAGTGAFQGTWPTSINDNGDIAGFYFDSSNVSHGFVRSRHGQFVTVDDPNATDGTMIALEQGLNSRGAVAGWYFAGAVQYGFVGERDGKFDTIEPSASAQFTYVGGINCAGAITGYFGATFFSGYLQKPNGHTTIFNVSGPDGELGTAAFTLNSRDEITGVAVDVNNANHGFVRFADGDIKTFDAPKAGPGSNQGTRPTTINDAGQVVGWVLDSDNVAHGFILCLK